MVDKLEEALRLAKHGLRVHPLQKQNKVPILGKWQERATTDEAKIRVWAGEYPDCNWGVATGPDSGVLVVDIDPKNGGDANWEALVAKHGGVDTPVVRTGSGGTHYYFKYPKGSNLGNSRGKLPPGIDIRGINGQVVAPGSIHPNGTPYSWVCGIDEVPFSPIPLWLLELISAEEPKEYSTMGEDLEDGNWNNSIFHNARAMARMGVKMEFCLAAIRKWVEDEGYMPDDQIEKAVESAYKDAKKKPVDVNDRSDTYNAEALLSTYGEDMIFVPGMGWFHWSGKVWEPDIDGAVAKQQFIKVMKAMRDDAAAQIAAAATKGEAREAAAAVQWAIRSMSASAISNAVGLASTFSRVRRTPADIDPVTTDWLLNFQNGTVDLKTGEMRKHNKRDMITKMVPSNYRPDAEAPFWRSTMGLIFQDNAQLIDYMWKALGYSVTGSIDERCFFICWGEAGANGKSTILETVQEALGPGYSQMSDMVVITTTVDNRVSASLAKLQGARFVSMNEAEENQRLSEALIKQLTGGDTIQARHLYQAPFEYKPVFKLWIRTNDKPIVRSQNNAIWDRIKLIPFERSIPKESRLPRSEVDERLRAEREGILAWLVSGAMAWRQGQLADPKEVTAAVNGYRTDSDIVKAFIEECIEENPTAKVRASEAYQAFVAWCRDAGERYVMNRTRFTQRMLAIIGTPSTRSGGQTYLQGVKLNQQAGMYVM